MSPISAIKARVAVKILRCHSSLAPLALFQSDCAFAPCKAGLEAQFGKNSLRCCAAGSNFFVTSCRPPITAAGDPSARRDPVVVSLKFQPDLVEKDPQVAVPTAHDRLRDNPLHLLRDNSDIGFFGSIIHEAIEAKAVLR